MTKTQELYKGNHEMVGGHEAELLARGRMMTRVRSVLKNKAGRVTMMEETEDAE